MTKNIDGDKEIVTLLDDKEYPVQESKKQINKPKRPLSAYFLFIQGYKKSISFILTLFISLLVSL